MSCVFVFSARRWFSGKISRCQRDAPGSIPGRRTLFSCIPYTFFCRMHTTALSRCHHSLLSYGDSSVVCFLHNPSSFSIHILPFCHRARHNTNLVTCHSVVLKTNDACTLPFQYYATRTEHTTVDWSCIEFALWTVSRRVSFLQSFAVACIISCVGSVVLQFQSTYQYSRSLSVLSACISPPCCRVCLSAYFCLASSASIIYFI